MKATEKILQQCEIAGVRLDTDGEDILASPPERLTEDLLATLKRHKSAVVVELVERQEQTRKRVWQELQSLPERVRYAFEADADTDPVRLVLGIRGIGTCDLLVRADKWDPARFLELLNMSRAAQN